MRRQLAHLQAGSPQQAKGELKEAVTIAPRFADAVLLLADLNIKSGAAQPAVEDARSSPSTAATRTRRSPSPRPPRSWRRGTRVSPTPSAGSSTGWACTSAHWPSSTDSAAKLPGNPMIHYHLGMVSAQLGDTEVAHQALSAAAAAPTPFPGQDEARKALAALK
ncbi:MAG: hypothetical protein HYY95_22295 [Candidatus Rokubacteria bacterium]|nr:hypothetical protein [Candidatus Rokubacteria bacterium]